MIPLLPLAQLASVLCVVDAVTGAPLVGAAVRVGTSTRVWRASCEAVRASGDSVQVRRAGYQPRAIAWRASGDTIVLALWPMGRAPQTLAAQRVVAPAARAGVATAVSQGAADARMRGAGSTSALLTLLPFTQLRTARGETGVSLRGARREQVVMTLDGLPLNDPATGVADVSDIPLAALGSATVAPGADPVGAGLGASGGVIALTTRAQQLVSLQRGAFGATQMEAATAGTVGTARWHAAATWRRAQNDFAFVNDAGVTPVREVRTNNDEARAALSAGVVQGATQLALLASTSERGMVGPANVRSYDHDRARTDRITLRLQQGMHASLASVGVRHFTLAYRDPTRPALDSRAQAWAADADWRGTLGPGTWRAGAGADGLTATGSITQRRTRGFAAYGIERALTTRGQLDVGVRTDAVERLGVQPTGSLGLTWSLATVGGVQLGAVMRGSQAVRVPTLYDLYFSSPQRLTVTTLAPERVTLDASTGITARTGAAERSLSGEVLAVSRTTREAIIWFPGNFGWSPANVGRETLRGLETRAAAVWGAWHADGWLTRYDALLHTNGLRIPTPYVARVAAGVRAQHEHRLATLSANARYVGRRPYTAGPRDPFFELPAVWLVDGAVSHHRSVHRTDVLVTLALDNATDARWQSVRGFPMPGRSWSLGITVEPVRR
ncbi:MAG: TonB-dependent receptor [Gemmatimonadaceae bacterium]|nr:TonB-dependent receptor [Gemmatimonadaceae bacterium]